MQHSSVMVEEVLERLNLSSGKTIVDGTLGLGGHAGRILEKLGPEGKLIGFDRDPRAIRIATQSLERFGERAMIIQDDFKNIPQRLKQKGVRKVDGILLDLGVSSMQLDDAERGFSFRASGPLDMRMDTDAPLTAEKIVNEASAGKLEEILFKYGQERYAKKIVRRIVEARRHSRIKTTGELEKLIYGAVPPHYRQGRIHPATRTFQALRIVVNDELGSLNSFLSSVIDILGEGARAVILSFQSLEDRAVKLAFREFQRMQRGVVLTKKPQVPAEEEIRSNPRARSAKLRVFEKKESAS